MGETQRTPAPPAIGEDDVDPALDAEVASVIAAHGGDAVAAVRALVVALEVLENQVEELVGGISAGYVRARLHARRG